MQEVFVLLDANLSTCVIHEKENCPFYLAHNKNGKIIIFFSLSPLSQWQVITSIYSLF